MKKTVFSFSTIISFLLSFNLFRSHLSGSSSMGSTKGITTGQVWTRYAPSSPRTKCAYWMSSLTWVTRLLPLHPILISPSHHPSLPCISTLWHLCPYLSRKQISLFPGFPEALAAYWVTEAGFKGGILREQLPLISSIWRFPLWLMCLGWWRSDPSQMAGFSLRPDKPLSTIPINPGPGLYRPASALTALLGLFLLSG